MSEPIIETRQLGDGAQPYNPVTLTFAKREVTMHTVTENELDTVASLSNSIDLGFFMGSGGVFVTVGVTLLTVPMATPFAFAGFIAATIVSGAGALLFGIRARISYREAQAKLREIKRGTPQILPPRQQ
jgi:hypothetical protein